MSRPIFKRELFFKGNKNNRIIMCKKQGGEPFKIHPLLVHSMVEDHFSLFLLLGVVMGEKAFGLYYYNHNGDGLKKKASM